MNTGRKRQRSEALQETMYVNTAMNSETPLMTAARNGNLEAVKYYLANGADPSINEEGEYDPLLLATLGGHTETVKELLRYYSRNMKKSYITAVLSGRPDIVWLFEQNITLQGYMSSGNITLKM